MKAIRTNNTNIFFNSDVYSELNQFIQEKQPSIIFILVDTNTHDYCLPQFQQRLESGDIPIEVMEMPDGEEHKTLDICIGVWEALSEYNADRQSILINLGGGVVTDLGGFVASTFMRGITYINIPTSLLAMVDASVGGKTGIDLGGLKNQVGVINEGAMVGIDTSFLDSLPRNEMVSGFAEMLKHGLISDKNYWYTLTHLEQLDLSDLDQLIYDSIVIKNNVVTKDPKEKGLRKILNFGHTLGHAIESYFLENGDKTPLLHGEAIAIGMILETYLSTKVCGLSHEALEEINSGILKTFSKVEITKEDQKYIMDLLRYDKKNSHSVIKFVLLEAIGQPKIDCVVTNEQILEAFDYYSN
ncbi:3-dehydroquinate synthase [Winogradskyella epiphytica]|uniref:3-dehydroquinate synthase n=1 Tax=Winogradskyella epiphytica TaxID=262005 RepID=A0A2V4XTM5_9FLAO|nr:3-dehydroquinate synthase [Winogradskyella epiphytica]PYE81721.1 3-dehydroquinate synthase [Winogradskyella epiphytica]GGW63143.1 3-dehydroquinate synthase [Winogradskyella epiphytica]